MNPKQLTKEEVLRIPGMRNKGMTNEQIAEELGISKNSVALWVKKLRDQGIEIKRFGRGGRKPLLSNEE